MPGFRHGLVLVLWSVLVLGACGERGVEVSAGGVSPGASIDVPGATRAELARVPKQFPLPAADPRALDATVGDDNGRQTITLRFAAEGWPAENALLVSDHLAALGWRIAAPAPSGTGFLFGFEGFGWSGEAMFKPAKARTADAVIELREVR